MQQLIKKPGLLLGSAAIALFFGGLLLGRHAVGLIIAGGRYADATGTSGALRAGEVIPLIASIVMVLTAVSCVAILAVRGQKSETREAPGAEDET